MTPPVAAPFSPFQQIFDRFWNLPITSRQRFFNPDQLRAELAALKQRDPAAYAALKAELD